MSKAASITAVIGATGTGKSTWINRQFLKPMPRRLLVWSHKPDYVDHAGPQVADLAAVIAALATKNFRVNFCPSWDAKKRAAQFDLFCRAALSAGNLTLIVEELHMVTSPSHAPAGWQQVTCIGRAYGLRVIGTSQRPAHMDKDFLSNATAVVCFRVNDVNAQRTMAQSMGVTLDQVKALPNYKYLHRDNTTGTVKTG
jgi:hypothetical protein